MEAGWSLLETRTREFALFLSMEGPVGTPLGLS